MQKSGYHWCVVFCCSIFEYNYEYILPFQNCNIPICDPYYLYFNIRNEKNEQNIPFGHSNIICYPSAQNQSDIAFSEKIQAGPDNIVKQND